MKWMIDSDFFNERIAMHCNNPWMPRDGSGDRRLVILQLMLCDSVNGKSWHDAEDFALCIKRPIKQCERVWQLCIEENVLRLVDDGYSAIGWLRERGYFNDDWKYNRQSQLPNNTCQQGQSQPDPTSFVPGRYHTTTKNSF